MVDDEHEIDIDEERELLPAWFYPAPPGGWTAEDLDRLPPSAPRCELIDGALVMMSPQTKFHSRVMRQLAAAIATAAPDHLSVDLEMAIRLGLRQRPEPDIVVADDTSGFERTWYRPEEVCLAVEIVSDESRERDRKVKPAKYAEAGIRHYWRIEKEDAHPVVYTYELDDLTRRYVATGIHRGTLTVSVPFPMEIDLPRLLHNRP